MARRGQPVGIAAAVEALVVLRGAGDDRAQRGHCERTSARRGTGACGPARSGPASTARWRPTPRSARRPCRCRGSRPARRRFAASSRRQAHRRAGLAGEVGDAAASGRGGTATSGRRSRRARRARRRAGRRSGAHRAAGRARSPGPTPGTTPSPSRKSSGSRAEAVDQVRDRTACPGGSWRPRPPPRRRRCGGTPRCCRRGGRAGSPVPARRLPTRPGTPWPSQRSNAWTSGAAHRLAEVEPIGELAGRLAVRLHHLLHRSTGRGQELADHADAGAAGSCRGRGAWRRTPPSPRRRGRRRGCRRTAASRRRTARPARSCRSRSRPR